MEKESNLSKLQLKDICLFIFIFFNQMYYTLQGSFWFNENMKIALIFSLLGLFGVFAQKNNKTSIKKIILFLLLYILVLRAYFMSNDTRIIFILFAILVSINSDYKKIIKYLFYSKGFFFLIALLSGGYHHINGVALHGGILLVLYVCHVWNRLGLKEFMALLIGYILLWIITDSGSLKISIGVLIFIVIITKFKFGKKIVCSKILYFISPILLLINYYFSLCIGKYQLPLIGQHISAKLNYIILTFVNLIDHYVSSRLTLSKYSLDTFGISFKGGNVNYAKLNISSGQYFNLDSGYMWLLQNGGIFITILIMFLMVIAMRYFIKTKHYELITATIIISLWAFNEDMFISIGTNFIFYFIGSALKYHFLGGEK